MFAEITMNRLPEAIINKIMLYVSHPVADLVRQEIDNFLAYDDGYTYYNRSDLDDFSGFYFEQYLSNHSCDCCAELWRGCQCWCVDCWKEYPKCRGECGNENVVNPSMTLQLSSDSE